MNDSPRHSVEILMVDSRVTARVEPIGSWLDFANEPGRGTIVVHDARIYANDVTDQRSVENPRLSLNKRDILAIVLLDPEGRKSFEIPEPTTSAVCHIGPFICRGQVHLGRCDPATMLDDADGDFFVMTAAYFSSRRPLAAPLPAAEMLLMNRRQVQMYYGGSGRSAESA